MKNILYYFYLLCWVSFVVIGVVALVGPENSLGFLILLQLVWGPISILHCFYKFIVNFNEKTKIAKLYIGSLTITIFYWVVISLLTSTGISLGNEEDLLFTVGIIIIPWTMLAFFTYILHLEKKEDLSLNV